MNIPEQSDHRVRVAAARRAKMRAHLMDAGLQVMLAKGGDGFTIDDVVAQAAVARGSFYKYFPTPAELVRAVALELSDELITTVNAVVSGCEDPALQAALGIRAILGLVRARPHLGAFVVRAGWPVSEPGHAFFRLVAPNIDAGLALGRFRSGHRSIALALVAGLCVGAMHSLITEDLPPDFAENVAEMMLCGLGIDPKEAAALARTPLTMPQARADSLLGRLIQSSVLDAK